MEITSINKAPPLETDDISTENIGTEDSISILVVSGRSGSGKTSALNILEDLGYYSIDNLPLSLVPADLSNFSAIHHTLQQLYGEQTVRVIYVTAQETTLVARFNATRRVHPLMAQDGKDSLHPTYNLPSAIKKEAELLEPIARCADIKIDTSNLNIHQLKECLRDHIGAENKVTINLLSFGFKYGSPIDADFIFDVRILPNPHWNPALRIATGLDTEVSEFFGDYPEVAEMTDDIAKFLQRWLPDFLHNNRHTVTVGIGCTGGKHRSVFITEQLQRRLSASLPPALTVVAKHREKRHW